MTQNWDTTKRQKKPTNKCFGVRKNASTLKEKRKKEEKTKSKKNKNDQIISYLLVTRERGDEIRLKFALSNHPLTK